MKLRETSLNCPRVRQNIECPECRYPACDAEYFLISECAGTEGTEGVIHPVTRERFEDPGHKEDETR